MVFFLFTVFTILVIIIIFVELRAIPSKKEKIGELGLEEGISKRLSKTMTLFF
jgi:hypothetical protein